MKETMLWGLGVFIQCQDTSRECCQRSTTLGGCVSLCAVCRLRATLLKCTERKLHDDQIWMIAASQGRLTCCIRLVQRVILGVVLTLLRHAMCKLSCRLSYPFTEDLLCELCQKKRRCKCWPRFKLLSNLSVSICWLASQGIVRNQ